MPAKIAVIYYSMYGHIKQLASKAVEGAKTAGATVDLYQFPETLADDILGKMHAPPKDAAVPFITPNDLKEYDGFIFAFPTRYGRAVAQVSAFFDATGSLWATGALTGKFASTIVSTASQNGGQETTHLTTIPYFAHMGIIYVPIGYGDQNLLNLNEIHGGSPYGASTHAGGDGSRQPSELEKGVAEYQGKYFAGIVGTFVAGKAAAQ
ncbi:benzoquinone reductase [Calocera viscosa TUFC12733]|uniref:Benzoquinone reductase n=1 Tax=Calocera viscosa (strain TUFC12733) TaxID=1330018 RepID=A0A167J3G4_CALVF|nr:benzoquinone reductase [Calocera viscosa TUFC12733]